MFNDFKPIDLARKEEYLEMLTKVDEPTSDYSLINLWGWAENYGLRWSFAQDNIFILQTEPYQAFWAPVGDWKKVDWSACAYLNQDIPFIRIPEGLLNIWKEQVSERLSFTEDRDNSDYIYSFESLKTLSGNKYHKKKNHVNSFCKSYNFKYKSLDIECLEDVLQMQQDWCLWRNGECDNTLKAENEAIYRTLTSWECMPQICGGVLLVDSRIVAYTVGEAMSPETLLIHFEKGRQGYRGIYQAINQMFLENQEQPFVWVNREQDLGDEGLRKSKMSYHPEKLLDKFTVKFSPSN